MKYRFTIELDTRADTVRVWDSDFIIPIPPAGRRRASVCEIGDGGVIGLMALIEALMGLYCECGTEDWRDLLKDSEKHYQHYLDAKAIKDTADSASEGMK
jgi:hypothetical protein